MTLSPIISVTELDALKHLTAGWRESSVKIALVPTMGALHEGHIALVRHAATLAERVVVSIFVNPTQFGPNEDFSRYPRDFDADLALLTHAGADAAWLPTVETMYPPGFATRIELAGPAEGLCASFRPCHFSGVATIVTKLFNQVAPDIAVFGDKDYQQLQVIRRLVRDLDLDVTIASLPTIREPDGLALSSRNRYLSEDERRLAPALYRELTQLSTILSSGEDADAPITRSITKLESEGFGPVQYLALRDADTLEPIDRVVRPARLLAAAYLGSTRLIDNVPIDPQV